MTIFLITLQLALHILQSLKDLMDADPFSPMFSAYGLIWKSWISHKIFDGVSSSS
jgi:hypothetical protein